MQLLDGKATAAQIREELKVDIERSLDCAGRKPKLTVILVGENPASQVYVRNKGRACEAVGIISDTRILPVDTKQEDLENLIISLNKQDDVDGILLQLPLPAGLDSQHCLELIDPCKDVDGFHPVNVGKLTLGLPGFRPCTPAGVLALLRRYKYSLRGKKAVVLGRSNIVGKPLCLLLSASGVDATVTMCHSRTENIKDVCREADFLFVAIGKPRFVTADMVKEGAVVIDVGINRDEHEGGKLFGDVDFEHVKDIASAITPVPGGIGPMTIAMLLVNTVTSWKCRCHVQCNLHCEDE